MKQSIPAYTLRGYILTYEDYDGHPREIALPDLTPGQSHTIVIENMNRTFSFDILRPNGFSATDY